VSIALFLGILMGMQSVPPPVSQVERCTRSLSASWRSALIQKPGTDASEVRFELFTMSREAADKVAKRVESEASDKLNGAIVVGMGPGAATLAHGSLKNWRSSPDGWFSQLCEIGVEAKAGYVELAVYRPRKDNPLFYVRWTSDEMPSGYMTFKVPEGAKPPF
jgi:hypothetical protein